MVLNALRDGMGRVNRAPAVLAGLLLVTFLLALPLGLVLRGMIRDSLGSSLAADSAANGVNSDWWEQFASQAAGVGETFSPRIIGFGAVLSNLDAVLDARPQALVVTASAIAYLLVWAFLVGGILDRYARNRPTRAAAFFAACGVYFFRFARLAVFAAAGYWLLFGVLHRWLFDAFYPWATRDVNVEQTAFVLRMTLYVLFVAALAAFNLWMDYAKVRAVVEDRHSMVGALMASFRFIRRHPSQTIGLYVTDGVLFLAVLALYSGFAPAAGRADWSMWLGLAVSEIYLLARLWVKLVFYASEVSLFQSKLAHAEYAAAPLPVWPESPSAEAIDPARQT
jgi:hypothetical protein